MKIAPGNVVGFHYLLRNSEGTVLESSHDGEPSIYLHGSRNILPMLEKHLDGHEVGDKLSVELDALAAYGPRKDSLVQKIAMKHLEPEGKKLTVGSTARLRTDKEVHHVTVLKLGKFQATVDANHPLAGQDIVFDIEVIAIRAAKPEELAHGHAHGLDGHAGH